MDRMAQLDQLEQLLDARLDLGLGPLADAQGERDVVVDVEVAKQREMLEYETDIAFADIAPAADAVWSLDTGDELMIHLRMSGRVLIAAAGVFLFIFDWNRAKPWVNEQVTAALGRPFAINGDLKVGSLEETITVSGQSPVVDTSTAVQQQVLSTNARNLYML